MEKECNRYPGKTRCLKAIKLGNCPAGNDGSSKKCCSRQINMGNIDRVKHSRACLIRREI